MGDWNEWNDLQETIDLFDLLQNVNKKPETNNNKEKVTELLNEPNKYVYKKKVDKEVNDEVVRVNKKITMYSSGGHGSYIVNPLDNTLYNARVGSKEEDNFFKVRFTAKSFPGKEQDIITLYYESPYVYERHHHTTLPLHIIKKWEESHPLNKSPFVGFNSAAVVVSTELPQTSIEVK